eukprot:CAMPEP_0117578136 /NCGR_PEP_ID=MMETSP0784-20121206/63827_1 /TAXON_ID=39447 /ORGANISM="" /LENGTH=50 /DNA_ID=CAMNT_0005377749 /DNA_START=24 /DNA_END=172 /DNA_ORIENTATION=+
MTTPSSYHLDQRAEEASYRFCADFKRTLRSIAGRIARAVRLVEGPISWKV